MAEPPVVVAGADAAAVRLARRLVRTGADVVLYAPGDAGPFAVRAPDLPVTEDMGVLASAALILDTMGDVPATPAPRLVAAYDPDPAGATGFQITWPWPDAALVEILPAPGTDPATLAAARVLADRLGCASVTGLPGRRALGTRMFARLCAVADAVFFDGSTPWEVDEALVAFGFPMGPYEAEDLLGLDLTRARPPDPPARAVPIAGRMAELGKLGRKTGAGWYRYPGGGGKVEDPIVADLALEEAYFAGTPRTDYSADEITRRLILALVNEAARLADQGADPADIDRVACRALGFPGDGPLAWADTEGAGGIVAQLEALAPEDPVAFTPAACLRRAAAGRAPLRQIG